jgi:tRNA/tmRNA/rRNA uracil-C5-methylase (TrmA/RlmC/RlmD family)
VTARRSEPLPPGRRIELRIETVAHGGHCLARRNWRVVFVRHTLPGERVLAVVTEDRGGSFLRADALEVLDASPERVEPACPVAGPGGCGGCDWQHASPAAQRRLKAELVAEQLARLAGVEVDVDVAELPGGNLRWRTHARFAVNEAGQPGFRAHRSHRVVAVNDCPITDSRAAAAVTGQRFPRGSQVDTVVDTDGAVHVARLPAGRGRARRQVAGSPNAPQQALGRRWPVSTGGFWQVHPAAADAFAAAVDELAGANPGELVWDLYGGAGLFAAALAPRVGTAGELVVVDSQRRAVADGRRALADVAQVRFVAGDVLATLRGGGLPAPDVVVADPPRKGAGREVVGRVAAAGPRRVVYVACDPAALARDVGYFITNGYRLSDLRAFDAFPMTHHVEVIAALIHQEHAGPGF